MEPFGIGMAGLGAAGLATFGAFGLSFRLRRRRLAAASASPAAVAAGTRGTPRSTPERLEALAAAQAELGQRLDALATQAAAPEERLQAMAGQLLGLIRDKNATLETALAGLDQLRARMRAVEQMGEPAEARALLDGLAGRLGTLETERAADRAATEARLSALSELLGGSDTAADFARVVADLGERLTKLQESRDARTEKALDSALARIAPLEARLGAIEGTRGEARTEWRDGLKRLEARLETAQAEGTALGTALAAARAEALAAAQAAGAPVRALAEEVARLHARKDEGIETVIARLGAIERDLAARDPEALVDARIEARLNASLESRVEGRLGSLDGRLAAIGERLARAETTAAAGEAPLAALAGQVAALQAARDAAAEAAADRLGPIEGKLAALEAALAAADPQGALDRFAERLEGVSARMTTMEGTGRSATEISERLAALHAQKDAAVAGLMERLGPIEARLAEIDPASALAGFGERLDGVAARVTLIEGAENPVAEITERLAELHARKDAAAAALLERLAPIEARLAEIDPASALAGFGERLDGVAARVALIEGAGNPVAEITERLAALHAQKDAAVAALVERLAPLEDRLAEIDPAGALDRFGERLEGVAARVALIEGAGDPVAEIMERLAELHAQKDMAAEALMQRLGPLEARLAAIDPAAALERFGERLAGVAARVALIEGAEDPVAEIMERLAELHAQKDMAAEALMQRLAPLEARLAEIDPASALAGFGARLEGVAARVALIEGAENPAAEIGGRLAELHAQKDAAVAALVERLGPVEARLAEIDPAGALDRFGERLEAVQARISLIEGADDPAAEIGGRLAELHAQKDRAVEALLGRLGPLEDRLAEIDPAGALDRFGERLEAVQARVALIEGAENPAAEIGGRLAELHAQKDAAVAALVERLAPLEARLAAVEGGMERVLPIADDDPRGALAALKVRLEGLDHAQEAVAVGLEALRDRLARRAAEEARTEGVAEGAAEGKLEGRIEGTAAALAEVVDGMTRLFAQKDAGIAALLARLAPLEERLAAVETRPRDPAVAEAVGEAADAAAEAEAARAEARAIAARLALVQAAAEASAERTALFADRISELEASLPRLSAAEARAMAAAVEEAPMAAAEAAPGAVSVAEALRDLPRVVSLHQK